MGIVFGCYEVNVPLLVGHNSFPLLPGGLWNFSEVQDTHTHLKDPQFLKRAQTQQMLTCSSLLLFQSSAPRLSNRLWGFLLPFLVPGLPRRQDRITPLDLLYVSHAKTLLRHCMPGAHLLSVWSRCHHCGRCWEHQNQASPRAGNSIS